MARGKKGTKAIKDIYDLLGSDEKEAIENSSDDELNKRIAEVAKNDQALQEQKKKDPVLEEIRGKLKLANESFAKPHKANMQRIKKCREILEGRGKAAGESGVTGANADY